MPSTVDWEAAIVMMVVQDQYQSHRIQRSHADLAGRHELEHGRCKRESILLRQDSADQQEQEQTTNQQRGEFVEMAASIVSRPCHDTIAAEGRPERATIFDRSLVVATHHNVRTSKLHGRQRRFFARYPASFFGFLLILIALPDPIKAQFNADRFQMNNNEKKDHSSNSNNSPSPCPSQMPAGVCAAAARRAEAQRKAEEEANRPPPRVDGCQVFMAPGTFGSSNLGIYTAVPLKKGDVVNYPEIVIPFLFREWRSGSNKQHSYFKDGKLWDRYIWEGTLLGIETYQDTNRQASGAAFVPGVGCTVNSVLDMHNIDSTRGSVYDTAGISRVDSPGAGAFSPYHSSQTVVTADDIPAGSELFAKYGDYWIPDIPGVQVTFHHQLQQAEDLVQAQLEFVERQRTKGTLTSGLEEALWDFSTSFPLDYNHALTNLPRSFSWKEVEQMNRQKHTQQNGRSELHSTQEHDATGSGEEGIDEPAQECIDGHDSTETFAPGDSLVDELAIEKNPYPVVESFMREKQYVKSIDWLHKHGYCQDHMRPRPSTLSHAGRGAFAARDLPKNAVVGFAPLIHIGVHGRELLSIDYSNVGGMRGTSKRYDLVLNYSFGHSNSTVLLTPYGGMVNYINHNSQEPNVRIRWPRKELVSHKPEWLQKNPTWLRDVHEKVGLSFEYVALRDIAKGEEIFMDYGREWETAWLAHLEKWKPVPKADLYRSASDIQEPYFRTVQELKDRPYPPNVATMCVESYSGSGIDIEMDSNLERPTFKWTPPLKRISDLPVRHFCVVAERHAHEGGRYTYTVDLKIREGSSNKWIRIIDVPDVGIGLYDLAFSRDWHMPNSFRHYIQIPDDLLPDAWKNNLDKK